VIRTDVDIQLKIIFRAIISYKESTSGTHWDNVNGAKIDGEAALSAWNNYINASPVCRELIELTTLLFTRLTYDAV
jgi:hypothetical protein